MMPHPTETDYKNEPQFIIKVLRQNLPIVLFLAVAIVGMFAVYWFFGSRSDNFEAIISSESAADVALIDPDAPIASIVKPVKPKPVTQRTQQSPPPTRVGLIAGHRGFDSGTECADGLTEVELNSKIVDDLAAKLEEIGINSDSLDEFDPRLENYFATALVSVHIDSCDYVNDLATGYKISGSPYTDSTDLSICMQQAYGEATNLAYHPNSISPDMENYHAFSEISPGTPALIIEIGFLNLDREILTDNSDLVVEGLLNGIACFFGEGP